MQSAEWGWRDAGIGSGKEDHTPSFFTAHHPGLAGARDGGCACVQGEGGRGRGEGSR